MVLFKTGNDKKCYCQKVDEIIIRNTPAKFLNSWGELGKTPLSLIDSSLSHAVRRQSKPHILAPKGWHWSSNYPYLLTFHIVTFCVMFLEWSKPFCNKHVMQCMGYMATKKSLVHLYRSKKVVSALSLQKSVIYTFNEKKVSVRQIGQRQTSQKTDTI